MTDKDDDDDLEKGGVSEITEMAVTSISGVGSPAHGSPWLLMKSAADESAIGYAPVLHGVAKAAQPTPIESVVIDGVQYAPVAKARESQQSDHDVEAITGSAVAGATCNAPCADGSMCSRSPAAGSARCHHHQGVALTLKSKGTDMEATKQLLEAGVSPERVAQLVENAAAFKKGQVQDRLNGGDTPELGGDIRMGNPGSLSPAQGSVSPKITATTTPNGLPGLVSSLEGGESAYQVNAGAEVNAGAGPSLTDMVRGRSQTLPAPPAGSNTLRGSVPGAVKEALAKARADVVETERAFKEAEQERGPLAAMSLERAGEAATRAALKEQALAQFGPR